MPRLKKDEKEAALRDTRTRHARPEDVSDPLFADAEFFDARDLLQVKYEMLRRVRVERLAVSRAAAAFGFSRPSFYQAQEAFQQGGLAGLIPQKRGPKQAHKLTPEIVNFLVEALGDDSLESAELVSLVEERFGVSVHHRTIDRALQKKKRQ